MIDYYTFSHYFIIVKPAFIHSSSHEYYYEEPALLHHDKFINCSIKQNVDVAFFIKWDYRNVLLHMDQKYSQNSSGLMIHNVTGDDYGPYSCLVGSNGNQLNATVYLTIVCKICLLCTVCLFVRVWLYS